MFCAPAQSTWKLLTSKLSSSASSLGTGKASASTRCGTHFLSLTAHAVNASTALSAYRSPHRIWRGRKHSSFSRVVIPLVLQHRGRRLYKTAL